MWVRLFGNNFVCTLLDSSNIGRIPRADVRMFNSRGSSPVHIISRELGAYLIREARQGFASLPVSTSTPKTRRRLRNDDSMSVRSDLTSVSRQMRPMKSPRVRQISCCSRASGSQSVVPANECSTSFRLMWDGDQMWDDALSSGNF
ncbi:hypothetical protein L596_012989 [Steinernema carpocapsae]|uniref:Uncharacterized protein n=1 Tax=Steinernema carpocapsae TaxID=34508 RepID=A0A4U5NZ20_STECR|nr:hypothetical protein L596_012989 [Steinernema carpocapsae]